MKVLFTFFIPSGGVETLNRLRCSVLNQHGIEAHTLYLKPGTGMQNNTGTVFITNHDNEIKSLLNQQQYDAIIVTSDINMIERLRLVLDYRGRIIYEAQGLGTREAAIETICTAIPYLQAHANAVLIPPTAHLQQLFAEICPFIHRFIIPNMLDTTTFTPIDTDIPPYPAIMWIGRLEHNKNWREFLHISHRIIQHKPNAKIWVFHDPTLAVPTDEQQFYDTLKALELEDKIGIFSNIPNSMMPHYYSMAARSGGIMLSTSIMEGFGYAVAEAISCGVPVLSSDSDGVRAFITHNQTGKFYALGNVEQAAAEAIELMDNHALREHIRRAGREHLVNHFSGSAYAVSFRQMMNALSIF
ncbi:MULTISPECIES: glycosyltransferase family 4 protein [unclassified Paenibacillus]|uniref:Glycosyltransferase family 4 protein n=1 Tax=Paenibacillus provencensis TaxID=441151 RepID=A0ABW3Q1H1_9BACL|nr:MULTISPECIES: glycosyltransferase family 4 protein [unclassified Paenibacillus]MCM3129877.1 glycosyltransferase family 4 protein [Paenibacillus sp. MER 78]SFS91267.1 Glycosyl transferases group 1 [Paenibacillus sp. 453mf]